MFGDNFLVVLENIIGMGKVSVVLLWEVILY